MFEPDQLQYPAPRLVEEDPDGVRRVALKQLIEGLPGLDGRFVAPIKLAQQRQVGVRRCGQFLVAGLGQGVKLGLCVVKNGHLPAVCATQLRGNFEQAGANRVAGRHIGRQAEDGLPHAIEHLPRRMLVIGK